MARIGLMANAVRLALQNPRQRHWRLLSPGVLGGNSSSPDPGFRLTGERACLNSSELEPNFRIRRDPGPVWKQEKKQLAPIVYDEGVRPIISR